MALSVKYLPNMQIKETGQGGCILSSYTAQGSTCAQLQHWGGRHRKIPGACWLASQAELIVPSLVRDPASEK